MKEKQKRIWKEIGIIIFLLFLTGAYLFTKPLGDLDELWNYNFANQIVQGLVPYLDFNMVPTPFVSFVCAIFLTIFSNELMVMRVLGVILATSILWSCYHILKCLTVNYKICCLATLVLFWVGKDLFTMDYNFFTLLLILVILWIEIKSHQKQETELIYHGKQDLLLGILAGIAICSKQSTGIILSFVVVGYRIIEIRKKEMIFSFLKIAITRAIGVCIPVLILLIYFIFHGALYDFVDYTILGIKTFSNSIPYILLFKQENLAIRVLSIIVPITIAVLPIYAIIKKDKIAGMFFFYSVASMVVAFPISDAIHFLIGSIPAVLGMIYLGKEIGKKLPIAKTGEIFLQHFLLIVVILIGAMLFVISGSKWMAYGKQITKQTDSVNHYQAVVIPEKLKARIEAMEEYITKQDKKVYILDAEAVVYQIPLEKHYKNYDMFSKGNLGGKGEQGQIEVLQKQNDALLLIRNEKYVRNWQTPEEVRKYIVQNRKKISEIEIFDIYE